MKASVLTLGALALLWSLVPASTALADRGSVRAHAPRGYAAHPAGHRHYYSPRGRYYAGSTIVFGSLWYPFGYPYYGYPYWGYPYYAYPPAVYEPLPEYSSSATAQPPSATWYYCRDSKTYYPYVSECPGGWESVPATPPEPAPSGKSN